MESAGTFSAVLWTQELWFGEHLLWTAEHMSPLAVPVSVGPNNKLKVSLNDAWRQTNVLSSVDAG